MMSREDLFIRIVGRDDSQTKEDRAGGGRGEPFS